MGISCEINLLNSPYEAYLPGQVVSGLIKYTVAEPMELEKITTSLKGRGFIFSEFGHYGHKYRRFLRSGEIYIDLNNTVQNSKVVVPVGSHEIEFSFKIPHNLPSTVNIYKYLSLYDCVVNCRIKYYIRIKFKKPGIFSRNRHFTKEITVYGITPRLPRTPVMYEEKKKLLRLFSSKQNILNIKATIPNSIIPIGDKIELNYQVENNSNILVKSINTKVIELSKFRATAHYEMRNEEIVPDTNAITTFINCGDTQIIPIEVRIPSEIYSIEYAQMFSRYYLVRIEAALPIPHRNVVLNIPIQVGTINDNVDEHRLIRPIEDITCNNLHQFHWDTMSETKKRNDDISIGTFEMGEEFDTIYN